MKQTKPRDEHTHQSLAASAGGGSGATAEGAPDAVYSPALATRAELVLSAGASLEKAALLEVSDDAVGDVGCVAVDELRGWGGNSKAEDEGECGDGELHVDWKCFEGGLVWFELLIVGIGLWMG